MCLRSEHKIKYYERYTTTLMCYERNKRVDVLKVIALVRELRIFQLGSAHQQTLSRQEGCRGRGGFGIGRRAGDGERNNGWEMRGVRLSLGANKLRH